MKHFKLTTTKKVNFYGITLFQIELIIDCKWGKTGKLGGWVEKENSVSGDAWVSGNAEVFGDAEVSGNAWVFGDAKVFGNAWVSGNAEVFGNAWVSGNAEVSGDAKVFGDAWVKSPLQIQGTRHFVNVCKKFFLRIGCNEFSFEYWNENFKSIGEKNNYSESEINEYGLYISLAISLYGLNEANEVK